MYTSTVAALIVELFGKSRWSLIAASLGVPAAWLAAKTYLGTFPNAGPVLGTPVGFIIMVGVALQLGAIFAYVDLTPDSKGSGFPRHILLLPVPTWLLALVPILAGSVFISAFVLLWLHYLSGVEFDSRQQLIIAGAITSLMCWIQAMSWELVPLRYLRLVVLLVAATAAALSVTSLTAQDPDILLGRAWGAVGLLGITLGGFALAYLAVVRSRRGESLDVAVFSQRLLAPVRRLSRNTPLPRLPAAGVAQDWYEWRVYGRSLPIFMGFLVAGPMAITAAGGLHRIPSLLLPAMLLFMFLAVSPVMGGVYVSRKMTRRVDATAFGASRPLSDLEVAFAKLKLTIKSHLLAETIVGAGIAILLVNSTNNTVLLSIWSRLAGQLGAGNAALALFLAFLVLTATSWAVTTYFMALQLFGDCIDRKKHGWTLSVVVLALFVWLLNLGRTVFSLRDSVLAWLGFVHYGLLTPVLVLAAAAIWMLTRLQRSHGLQSFRKLGAGFAVTAAVCMLVVWQLNLSFGYRCSLSCLVAADALLVFIPFLLVPILIDLGRHR